MRLRVLSDLHREFGHVTLPEMAADVVVLAGDIDLGLRGIRWAKEVFPGMPVLYVAGNHEFYGETLENLLGQLRTEAAGSNVRFLENDSATIGGYRFFGATLWTDFRLLPEQQIDAMLKAKDPARGMTDYREIRTFPGYRRLKPANTLARHSSSVGALKEFLANGPRDRSVVVTHHAPSAKSLANGWENDLLSAAYASDLDALIKATGPSLWIHGHTHLSRDNQHDQTRVVSNQLGYPGTASQVSFRADFVVDLP